MFAFVACGPTEYIYVEITNESIFACCAQLFTEWSRASFTA